MYFTFTKSARKDYDKLPKKEAGRLQKKIIYWQDAEYPLEFAKPLTNSVEKETSQTIEATHRFRFGAYRILIKLIDQEMRILHLRHRKDVYKR